MGWDLQLLLWFPLAAAIGGAAFAVARFAGQWVAIGLTAACVAGAVVCYGMYNRPIDQVRADELGVLTLAILGMVLVIAGASGPAIFGRRKAASLLSVSTSAVALFTLPLFAGWSMLMRSGL